MLRALFFNGSDIEMATDDDSRSFMTNQFKCDLVHMAGLLAEIPHIDLLVYIQREVYYDVSDGSILYNRAIDLLENCINWIITDSPCGYDDLQGVGFDDWEIESLGYSELIPEEEE